MDKPLKRSDLFSLLSIVSFIVSIGSAKGLQCYVCSSDKLEDCSTLHSIEELPLELCPADVASCFTRIKNGKTIRGCQTNLQQTLCENELCSFCRSNKCNAQIFPEDRLSCLHCEGPNCVNQASTVDVRHPCAEYDVNDECYSVFSYDGSVAYRGCISDKNPKKDFCIENHAQCHRCKKRACNSEHVQFEKELSCVKCHPDENSNCNVVDANTTATECARTSLGYLDLCYTLEKGGVSYRGCLYEASDDIFVECNDPFSEACLTCNQTDCNRTPRVNEDLTLNPFHYEVIHDEGKLTLAHCGDPACEKSSPWEIGDPFCYKCDSKINPNCTNALDDTMIGMCDFEGKHLGCYHMITDAGVVRGCVAELEDEMKQKCMENDDSCKTCFYGKCNSRTKFMECLVTDEDQSEASNSIESSSSPKICQKYDEKCFIQVLDKDRVIRGCVDTYAAQNDLPSNFLDAVANKRSYEVCSTPLCNDKELKPMYCVSCNSTDKNCIDDPNHSELEKSCSLLDACYHFDNGSYIERGCISDLDENQRVECESNSYKCKTCFGDRCNVKQQFLRCIGWSIAGQVHPVSKYCQRYDDECFILVKNDSVIRGCLKDFSDSPLPDVDIWSDRLNPEIYESCSTPDCNGHEIEPEYCTICDSKTENLKLCEYGPTDEMREQCPLRMQKLGCYLQQGNLMKRGCVAEFSHEERNLCGAFNGTCKMCEGDNCNKKQYFEVCTDCSSEANEKCISQPGLTHERTCPNYMDQCYIHIKDGIVRRNCTGDNFITSVDECNNSKDCSLFTGTTRTSRCNSFNLAREVCIVCDSDESETCKSLGTNQEEFAQECPLSVEPQGCYHFIDEESGRHVRGCVSDLTAPSREQYNEKPDEFRICKQPKCNSLDRFEKCLVCDSAIDPDCATNPDLSSSKVCENYKNMCFTRISKQNVVRGCLNDIKETPGEECRNNKEKCLVCSSYDGIGCNDNSVTVHTCIECNSNIDGDCQWNPKQSDAKICTQIGLAKLKKGCYLSTVGDHVKRGCIQDLPPSIAQECLNGTSTCKSCPTSNCNLNPTLHECYSCNSKDDPLCAKEYPTTTEMCQSNNDICTTGIDEEGFIHRACDLDYKYIRDGFLKNYRNCAGSKCNSGIFPENRLRCYQCNGNEDCDFVSPNSTNVDLQPQPCAILSQVDQCFTYINQDKKIFRGCLSDSTKIRLECEGAGDKKQGHCVKCTGSGCNDQPKVKPAKLSCVKCIDTEECAFGQNSSSAISCLNDVTFGGRESCFVYRIPDTSTIDRGCTLDVNATNWCNEENGCEKCLEKGCNTKNARHSWCLRCHSDTNGNCAKVSDLNEFTEECDHSSYAYNRRGCYTAVKGGNVTRGCIIDLNGDEYENCQQDQSCDLCLDDQCNKKPKTNSGLNTSASYLMCLCIALITCFRFIH